MTAIKTIIIQGNSLGQGDQKLGEQLLKNYLYTLARQDKKPRQIFFLNSGVKLTCKGSESLEDLQLLLDQGVEMSSCATCLNYYNLEEELICGKVGTMLQILDAQLEGNCLVLG